MRLSQQDLSRLLAAVQRLHAHPDFATLPHLMVSLQSELVRNDFCAFTAFSKDGKMLQAAHDRPDLDLARLAPPLEAHYHEHPVVAHCQRSRSVGTWKISDFLTQTKFERLGLYNEFYQAIAARFQSVSYLVNNDKVEMHLACNRQSKDFSERDRMMADLLRPHFAQAYLNGQALHDLRARETQTHAALSAGSQGLIFLTGELKVERMTGNCEGWLNAYFHRQQNTFVQLPDALRRWVESQRTVHSVAATPDNLRAPLVVNGPGGRLTIRCWPEAGGKLTLLLTEQVPPDETCLRFAPLSELSKRQNEVLHWMVEGKRNAEIAVLLHRSERTVEKHVEQILHHLKAENRATAIVRALEFSVARARR